MSTRYSLPYCRVCLNAIESKKMDPIPVRVMPSKPNRHEPCVRCGERSYEPTPGIAKVAAVIPLGFPS